MGRLQSRLEVLPAAQRALWHGLQDVRSLGWVLYGGTAVALRLAHRASVDFDFFNDKALDRHRLGEACPGLGRSTVSRISRETGTLNFSPSRCSFKILHHLAKS